MTIEYRLETVENELKEIKKRNQRVEADKAWETSAMRKVVIFVITYIVAALWLVNIEDTNPLLKALVPAFGWYLSTLSLSIIKRKWIDKKELRDL
ncbi:MAG: hypothetical protein COX81_00120 [Candidatus Magasanikbacteria bacterium CG_4_10_14_0_2_um_filter_37_12]|uniref:Uncharacterized protein n=1 Tax=Candidatus Magasanikbacteria bacterium CG_4_10_14_0_2_um_filter_37_12 TaxID=1974637 RepID=A0A2M7VAH4_9BACT|nr:MAG: hypothetical protein COX81_00120 [Candidatus Magasanikbacteria bacterium CG_4_10_14_0_2_um_filter_37_12]